MVMFGYVSASVFGKLKTEIMIKNMTNNKLYKEDNSVLPCFSSLRIAMIFSSHCSDREMSIC